MIALLAHEKWSLSYQAWRIAKLTELLNEYSRKEALAQLEAEEISRPWQNCKPLPALNPMEQSCKPN